MIDKLASSIKGHLTIVDKHTREVLLDKDNAIHYGNISSKIAESFIGKPSAFLNYMVFGNGGVTVDSVGSISYNDTNTSSAKAPTAQLFNTTFVYEMTNYNSDNQTDTSREVNTSGIGNYEDIECVVTLDQNTPSAAQLLDLANGSNDTTLTNTSFVFNEIALYTGLKNQGNKASEGDIISFLGDTSDERPTLVTHVVFHPIQKSTNRTLEITYKLRIQMGD